MNASRIFVFTTFAMPLVLGACHAAKRAATPTCTLEYKEGDIAAWETPAADIVVTDLPWALAWLEEGDAAPCSVALR